MCFDQDKKASPLSSSLRASVILDWYNTDLVNERMRVYRNFLNITLVTLVAIVGIWFYARKILEYAPDVTTFQEVSLTGKRAKRAKKRIEKGKEKEIPSVPGETTRRVDVVPIIARK